MRGSRKFCQRGPNLITFLQILFDEGIEYLNITIYGPLSAHKRNAIEMAFRWQAKDGPILNADLVAL